MRRRADGAQVGATCHRGRPSVELRGKRGRSGVRYHPGSRIGRSAASGAAMTFLDVLPKLSERRWQQQLVDLAALCGWATWHDRATNAPRRCPKCKATINLPRNDPGWPDLFMIRGDTLIVAELKADRGATTQPQRDWLAAFRAVRRIIVAVYRPKDWPEVEAVLKR